MNLRTTRRAVCSAALLETVELRRLLSVGPDNTFGTAGVSSFDDSLPATSQYDQVVAATSGSLITTVSEVSDLSAPLENQLLVRRFTANGSPLSANTVTLPFSAADSLVVTDVALDNSNTAYIAGTRFDSLSGTQVGFVVKVTAGGALDASFAGDGSLDTAELSANSQNVQLAVSGGSVFAAYVTGNTSARTGNVLALDAGGNAILTYGNSGVATASLPQDGATINQLLTDGSGLLIVGSTFVSDNDGNTPDPQSIYAARFDVTGALDTNFATAGFGVSAAIGYSDVSLTGVVRSGSDLVVSGADPFGTQIVARLHADMSLDANFDGDGVLELSASTIVLSPLDRSTRTLTADSAGRVYATGITFGDDAADLAVIRLDSTGALDTGFDGDGVFVYDAAEADIGIGLITTGSDAILLAGSQIDGNTGLQTGLLVQFAEPAPTNSAPVVSAVATAGSVNTGVNTNFSASFSDADAGDAFTVAWDFGDGNTLAPAATAQGAVSASHVYGSAGTYTVTVTIDDGAGHIVSNTGSITVNVPNVAPVVSAVSGPGSVNTGIVANFTSSFSDANAGDSWTVAWNFGDGNTTAPTSTAQGAVSASHAYAVAGTYTITVTIDDGAGHIVSNTGTIVVTTPPPPTPYTISGGQLALTGSANADTVELVRSGSNYVLSYNGTPYTITNVLNSIVVNGGNGADFIRISSQITIPVTLIGGAGNDTLRGGSGDDVMTGDDGADLLIGRDGQDLMIGGTGADFLIGREDSDILISGTSTLSSNLAALSAIMAEWTSSHALLVKLANVTGLLPLPGRLNGNNFLTPDVTVFGDSSVDTLSGGDGADLYYITLFGLNGDIIRDNQNTFAANIAALVFGD